MKIIVMFVAKVIFICGGKKRVRDATGNYYIARWDWLERMFQFVE